MRVPKPPASNNAFMLPIPPDTLGIFGKKEERPLIQMFSRG
jgi:hypothetical protein